MAKMILPIAALLITASAPAFAQSQTTVVREAVPTQSRAIVANSPEDLALQEEIRKIRAYNAYVDSQIGVSGSYEQAVPAAKPATPQTYRGQKVELYEQMPQITYTNTQGRTVPIATRTTIIERQPAIGQTGIYTVAEGDTLYSLARKNCVEVVDIQRQNGMAGSGIRLGQVLTMPANQCAGATITAGTPSKTVTDDSITRRVMPVPSNIQIRNSNKYAVLPKDSLYAIGKRYCTSANAIATASGIDAAGTLQPGQILTLPEEACTR